MEEWLEQAAARTVQSDPRHFSILRGLMAPLVKWSFGNMRVAAPNNWYTLACMACKTRPKAPAKKAPAKNSGK